MEITVLYVFITSMPVTWLGLACFSVYGFVSEFPSCLHSLADSLLALMEEQYPR